MKYACYTCYMYMKLILHKVCCMRTQKAIYNFGSFHEPKCLTNIELIIKFIDNINIYTL